MKSMIESARFALFLLKEAGLGTAPSNSRLRTLYWVRRAAWIFALCLFVFSVLTYPLDAGAMQMFDPLVTGAEATGNGWFRRISSAVRPTFILLGTIEICWAAALWAFEKDNLSSFSVEIIKKIMTIGFFFVLLENAPIWLPQILGTFERVGEVATQQPDRLSTDRLLTTGIAKAAETLAGGSIIGGLFLLAPSSVLGTEIPGVTLIHEVGRVQITVAGWGALIVLISFVIVAAQYFCLKVESAILFAAGAIFLGMGSSSWTRDYVQKYLNYAINVGVRLLVLILVLSITLGRVDGMVVTTIVGVLEISAAALVQALLAMKAPELAGSLLNGGAGLTAGSVSGGGGALGRGVASVASTAMSAGKAMGNLAKAAGAGRSGGAGGPGALKAAGGNAQGRVSGLSGGNQAGGQPGSNSKPSLSGLSGQSSGGGRLSDSSSRGSSSSGGSSATGGNVSNSGGGSSGSSNGGSGAGSSHASNQHGSSSSNYGPAQPASEIQGGGDSSVESASFERRSDSDSLESDFDDHGGQHDSVNSLGAPSRPNVGARPLAGSNAIRDLRRGSAPPPESRTPPDRPER